MFKNYSNNYSNVDIMFINILQNILICKGTVYCNVYVWKNYGIFQLIFYQFFIPNNTGMGIHSGLCQDFQIFDMLRTYDFSLP